MHFLACENSMTPPKDISVPWQPLGNQKIPMVAYLFQFYWESCRVRSHGKKEWSITELQAAILIEL